MIFLKMGKCFMNETAAKDWLNKAWHHFSSATLLYKAEHYTDVIAIDLHYAVEITLKSILAYDNKRILKTHDLNQLSFEIEEKISFDYEEQKLLAIVTKYHIKGSYPTPDRTLPSREEIGKVLEFTEELFNNVCKLLNISIKEVYRNP